MYSSNGKTPQSKERRNKTFGGGPNSRVRHEPRTASRSGLMLACGMALAFGTAPAWSQQSTLSLEPITVEGNSLYDMKSTEQTGGYAARAATVGTKTPATLRAIPQSVSVVTRDVIEDRNYTTLDELARGTPALRVLNNDNGRSSIYSRGYEYTEYNINGLPAPMTSIYGTLPNLAAFDRVEVLRGPSGLFNSTSGMGGIINLVLKKPTDTFQGHLIGRYGSWHRYYTGLDVSGPLFADGAVRGRLVVAKKGGDGFPTGNEVGSGTIYGVVEFDLSDDTLLSLGMLRQTRDLVPNNGLPTDANGDLLDNFSEDLFFGASWNNFEMESYDTIAELTHEFENGGYGRIAVRYSDRNTNYNYAFAGSALTNDKAEIRGIGRHFEQSALSVDSSYSQTFETFGNASEFVVGVDYKRYETDVAGGGFKGPKLSPDAFWTYPYIDIAAANPSLKNHTETEAYGLYSKLTFRPLESLALIGGVRIGGYDVQADVDSKRQTVHDTRSDDIELTPYAGLVYDVNRHHSLYASYSTVFKPQVAVDRSGQLLEPREGEQYEAGIKSSYFAGALNARLTFFHLADENTGVSPFRGAGYKNPIGKREVQGVEVELTGSPTPNWDIMFGYTYLDTKVVTGESLKGSFLIMPEHRANLWTQYHFTHGVLDGLSVGAGVTAVGEFESSRGVEASGYVVANATVGYQFTDKLSGQINIHNIFDNEYYSRVGSSVTFNMRGEPANVMASLRYDF